MSKDNKNGISNSASLNNTNHNSINSNNISDERLLDMLGEVDERYIEEAAPSNIYVDISKKNSEKSMKLHSKYKWLGIAASFMLIAGVGIALWQLGVFEVKQRNDEVISDTRWPQKLVYVDKEENATGELGIVPKWDEMSISVQFSEFDFEERKYSTRVCSIADNNIGLQLGEIMLEGYDTYEDKTHKIQANVYEIKGINTECATAIKFEGDSEYYVYVNSWYRPADLAQLIEDLNLTENVQFGNVHYNYTVDDKRYNIEFDDIDDKLVWNMLLIDTTLPNVHKDTDWHISTMSISVDIPVLGYENISLAVTEDGYLTTNILDTGKCFYIGEEKVQSFVDYVTENCEGYEIVYIYSNENDALSEKEENNSIIDNENDMKESEKGTVVEETSSQKAN